MSNTAQLSARERIMTLLDNNSFVEVGALVTKRNTDFNLNQKEIPSDGVITGYGIVEGKPVYVYSQDSTAHGGSIGEMHSKKITKIYDMALKVGAPVIGLIHSSGLRLEEATDALNGFGEIYLKQTLASGVIPQITAVFGNSGGGLAIMATLSDFLFMDKSNSHLFVNAPNTLSGNYKEKQDTSSAKFQSQAGNVDYVGDSEEDLLHSIRQLIRLLPSNYNDKDSYEEGSDDLNRLIPGFMESLKDTKAAIIEIADHNQFYETKAHYGKEIITGFIRFNGATIGVVANRSMILDETGKTIENLGSTLTTQSCEKASSFVRFCDSFEIPLLTLTTVTGFKATVEEERTITKAVARLTHSFADATVPKVNLIIGKAYGSAYIAMNSKHIGADLVFALPSAEIAMMDAQLAAEIIYHNDATVDIKEKASEYRNLQSSVMSAARRGYVDAIIDPQSVRKHLIYAFEMLYRKNEDRPAKKHGTK